MTLPTALTAVVFLLGAAAVCYGIFSLDVPEEGAGPVTRMALLWGGAVAILGDVVTVIGRIVGVV